MESAARNAGAAAAAMLRTRRKQTKPQRKKMGFEVDETSRHTDSSFADSDVMSPDSNHNDVMPLSCHESATAAISANGRRIRNGSIEDDQQQAVMEAIEAIDSIKVVNGRPHADDSFDNDSQDGRLSSQKYYSPTTPSSDLVIDEMSVDGQYNEQTDSPGMPEEAGTDNVPVAGLHGNAFLTKENIINGSPIDVPLGENEVAEFSPSAVKCPHCPKYYSGFDMLKEHIQLCHPERAVGYSCVQCNAAFSNREQLEKHQVLHLPESQVSCTVCNKNFANVYRLQRHMISHDESAVLRKFKCPQCEKAFKFKHHLKEHIRIHSGEKPFACEHCGKRFSHSGSYSSHNTSKKCLIMNLKVNHRNRNAAAAADAKSVANGQQPNANVTGSRVNAGKSKVPNNNNNNNTSVNNNNTKTVTNNNHHPNNHNNNNVVNNNHNNNNLPFASILPKYTEGAGILLPAGYPINPFYLGPTIGPYFPPNINQLLEQFPPLTPSAIAVYRENMKELEEASRSVASGEDGPEITIKKEIKMEEEECEKLSSASSSTSTTLPAATVAAARPSSADNRRSGNDLEAVKRMLESVNESVTKQQSQQPFPLGLSRLPSTSCSSGCPSISSEVPSSPAIGDDTSHDSAMAVAAACRCCGHVCHSIEDLQHHEKFICSGREDTKKSEGLAARLRDIISSQHEENGLSAFNSDDDDDGFQGSEKEVTVTEDEDFDGVSDGRKVRVRSQIAEEQLVVLKQHYARNPRPKREELEVISQRVGFPVRVVQVWFQNNRARDRREGRFVPIPYPPPAPYPPSGGGPTDQYPELSPRLLPSSVALMDQPLDLSTKKSNASSPASSPYPYDSDECGAVNLSSRKSPPSAHLHHQMALATLHATSTSCCPPKTPPAAVQLTALLDGGAHPTTPPLTPEKRLLPYQPQRLPSTPNSGSSVFYSMERIVFACNPSHSPVTSSSPIYNGSCSPNSSDSWKQEYLHSNDLELKDESRMGEDNMSFADCRTVVTSTKKPKINSNNSTDSENKGDRPHRCDICPKAFKHKHHLTEHKRLHSGEKPFQCKKCLKRFSHSGSYSQHKNHRFSYCKPYRD